MNKVFAAVALIVMASSTFSQATDTRIGTVQSIDIEGDRSRIHLERARAEARYEKENAACYARFAVTDCLAQVRARRRETLDSLRRQDVALNDVERKRKALEQIARSKERSSVRQSEEDAARRLEAGEAQQEREERAKQKTMAAMSAKSGPPAAKRERKTIEAGRTAIDIASEQKQYQNKLDRAREYRASREKSNTEKPEAPVKPLPQFP